MPGHPESPRRLEALAKKIRDTGLDRHTRAIKPLTDPLPWLDSIHSREHIEHIRRLPIAGNIAALAVSAALSAVDAVCRGEVGNAFCAVRPPGHHAHNLGYEEGFCYYNSIAVAARYAQKVHGCGKVLIIDWDYHHGNGTEEAFYSDPSVLFFSTHKWRAYPVTGDPARKGRGEGLGYTLNVDLPAGTTDMDMLSAWDRELIPAAEKFKPDLVLISAGFDARKDDTLGDFCITDDGFRRMTRQALALAGLAGKGRVVSLLEGGYNPEGLAHGVAAHLEELLAAPRGVPAPGGLSAPKAG